MKGAERIGGALVLRKVFKAVQSLGTQRGQDFLESGPMQTVTIWVLAIGAVDICGALWCLICPSL